MKFLMTCKLCGHQEWGSEGQELMNRIKLWNHIEASHPQLTEVFTEDLRVRGEAGTDLVEMRMREKTH